MDDYNILKAQEVYVTTRETAPLTRKEFINFQAQRHSARLPETDYVLAHHFT
jgi:hypothetical protein